MRISQGLKVNVGVNPQNGQSPVTAAQNSDAQFILQFLDEQDYPLDVTAAAVLAFKVLEEDGTTVLSKDLISGIAPVAGYPNQVEVSLVAADLALLPTGENDCAVHLSLGGQNYVFNLYDGLSIQPPVV